MEAAPAAAAPAAPAADDDSDDADDPVEREMDVFLSHTLASSTYLLQFPLQSAQAADATELLRSTTECRMKPHRSLLEVDLKLDTQSANYDPDSRLCAETRTLKSSAVPSRANYAVGAMRGGELHLTPLHATLQLRPSFHRVDELDEKLKEASGQPKDDPRAAKKAEASSAGPQLYQVTIKRAETERTIERRQRSHAHLKREEEKDPWLSVDVNNLGTAPSARERAKLFADTGAPVAADLGKEAYLDLLSPPLALTTGSASTPTQPAELSMHALRRLDLAAQVHALLRHAGVIRFDRVVAVLQTGAEQEGALIDALERDATVVQGCWVAQSALVCTGEEASLLPFRDKLCLALVQDEFVDRQRFEDSTGLHHLAATRLFESLTVKEAGGKGSRLKVAADAAFCAKHASVVAKHKAGWLARASDIAAAVAASGAVAPAAARG